MTNDSKIMFTDYGVGKELADLLILKLGIPPHVSKFSVHFCGDDAVTVDCTYFPTEPKQEAL